MPNLASIRVATAQGSRRLEGISSEVLHSWNRLRPADAQGKCTVGLTGEEAMLTPSAER